VISDSSQQAISVDNGRATSHEQTHPEPAIRSARSAVTRRAATRTTATCWKRGEHRTPTQNVTAIADVAHPERHVVRGVAEPISVGLSGSDPGSVVVAGDPDLRIQRWVDLIGLGDA
jgi:hypothetical protein